MFLVQRPFTNYAHNTEAMLFTEATEAELLSAAINFDESALSELYDRYEAKIYSYIYRRTGERTLAEDLTAQVFLKMLEAIRKDTAWHSSFSGWLYRIAHNSIVDYYRRRDRSKNVPIDDVPVLLDENDSPVQAAEKQFDADRLRSAVGRLTSDQAEVVSLRFLEGYSINEVATLMDKTEGAIKALQYRAVATLRQLLENEQLV